MFKYYMTRILTRPVFYLCIGCMVAVMLYDVREYLSYASESILNLFYFYKYGVADHCVVVMPIITSLPFLICFVEELNRKTKFYQMVRTDYSGYYNGIFGSAMVSAALVAMISVTIYLLICAGAGAHLLGGQQVYDGTVYETLENPIQFLGILLLSGFGYVCYGLMWPLFALLLSIFTYNRYVLYAAPFVIFYAWNFGTAYISYEIPVVRYLNPTNLLLYSLIHDTTLTVAKLCIYVMIFTLVLLGVLYVAYYMISMRKMMKNGG